MARQGENGHTLLNGDRYVTPKEAASLIGSTIVALEAMRKRGGGPPYSVSTGRPRYSVHVLDDWMRAGLVRNNVQTAAQRRQRHYGSDVTPFV